MTKPVVRRRHLLPALGTCAVLALTACGGSGFDDAGGGAAGGGEGDGEVTVLIGTSGDAETDAVQAAVDAWSEESGVEATLTVANDLPQQLSQGFAAGNPPDVFYVTSDLLAGYVANGSLHAYGDDLANVDDFVPTLVDTFTVDDQLQCAPKDFSTLALVINQRLWEEAGLTDADLPTTWDELADVAGQLSQGDRVGLAFGPEFQRVGAFMAQAGGALVNEDGTEATVDTPENLEALEYVQSLFDDGAAAFSSDLGLGWGGEAFGTEAAAMTIEGNWIAGAMSSTYPDVDYRIAPLPEGPGGPGTLTFTSCWGIAEASGDQDDAIALVEHLTAPEQQLAFAEAFGVIPSIQSAADQLAEDRPEDAPFVEGADYAVTPPTQEGAADVIADFNAQLEGLSGGGDPASLLASVQGSMQAVVESSGS